MSPTPERFRGFRMDTFSMTIERDQNLRHNILVNIADGAFFGFGVGFASYTTIIPLFVANLTTSATLIGLIPAIHNMGWQLPQLLLANKISRMKRVKPFVAFMTTQERLPIFGLAFVGLLLPKIGATAALIASFALLVWQGLGSGLTANAWQIMISKVIPGNIRGTFFGAQSAAANLLASLGAFLAGLLLVRLKAPYDFSTLFFIASGLYVLSWFFLNMTRETAPVQEEELPSPPPLWKNIKLILKTDHSFRNFLISRFVTQFGMMAFAFYTVFAVKHLKMSVLTVGVMTSILMITQVVANPLLGRLADKWSGKGVLVLGGLSAVLSAILAIIIKDPNWFVVVFILNGIAATAYWTIGITMSLQFGDERQRPTYVGMSNTLIAPSAILAPLVGGLLADSFGYSVTFITSAVIGLVSVFTLTVLVKDPKTR
jgi:MFS family permease